MAHPEKHMLSMRKMEGSDAVFFNAGYRRYRFNPGDSHSLEKLLPNLLLAGLDYPFHAARRVNLTHPYGEN